MDSKAFPLKAVPCNLENTQATTQEHSGVICQATPLQKTLAFGDGAGLAPDFSCLMDIPMGETLIEYRYHLEHNLDTREVSCEMADLGTRVDYRRGNFWILYPNFKEYKLHYSFN